MSFDGVLVPIITPCDDSGAVDTKALEQLVEHFISQGVAGIIACGTTGEYYSFSESERQVVLETIAKASKGHVTLIAGANAFNAKGAIENAKQAEEMGYEGLMLAPPSYSLPCQEGVKHFYTTVADATSLPIIMYNFPDRVGINIELDTLIELAKHPRIIGVKESSGDFSHALALVQANIPNFQVVCGCDDQAADFLFWGITSWISGSANVFPGEQVQMMKAAAAGDYAETKRLMSAMYPVIQSMEAEGYNQKAKLAAQRFGISAGAVRSPLAPLPKEKEEQFVQLLAEFKV